MMVTMIPSSNVPAANVDLAAWVRRVGHPDQNYLDFDQNLTMIIILKLLSMLKMWFDDDDDHNDFDQNLTIIMIIKLLSMFHYDDDHNDFDQDDNHL